LRVSARPWRSAAVMARSSSRLPCSSARSRAKQPGVAQIARRAGQLPITREISVT
jgi:hypothetical protein